jgi:predicted nucleotidyltransferase
MTVCGIIAEYNPFHNGHKYQLDTARELTGADRIAVIMGGNFTQRGEPAICDKRARAEMALRNGADIVIELPVYFATASAEYFAAASVKLLDDLGCVDWLCFGSESGDINSLNETAFLLADESPRFKEILRNELKLGSSFAKARGAALAAFDAELSKPNDILAVEYIKALKRLGSGIKPITVKRLGAGHHDIEINSSQKIITASASVIRKSITDGAENNIDIKSVMPPNSYNILMDKIERGETNCAENYTHIIKYAAARLTAGQIAEISGVTEGLENRIIRALAENNTVRGMAVSIKSKRYTLTGVYRALFRLLLDIKKEDFDYFVNAGFARYIRVLGYRKDGEDLFAAIRKNAKIPVLVNIKDAPKTLDEDANRMLNKELFASKVYHAPLKSDAMAREYGRMITFYPRSPYEKENL